MESVSCDGTTGSEEEEESKSIKWDFDYGGERTQVHSKDQMWKKYSGRYLVISAKCTLFILSKLLLFRGQPKVFSIFPKMYKKAAHFDPPGHT